MNKKQLLDHLLSSFSIKDIANAFSIIEALSKNGLLTKKYISSFLHLVKELDISMPDAIESIQISTSFDIDNNNLISNAFSADKGSSLTIKKETSNDVYLSVLSRNGSYKRSLDRDVDKLFG